MKYKGLLATVIVCSTLTATDATEHHPTVLGRGTGAAYAFPFFWGQDDGERKGLCLAISKNGRDWKMVNRGEPVFPRPFGEVFRDPAIYQGTGGVYHMVWTTDWGKKTHTLVGYARSTDLLHWQDAREIDLMGSVPSTINCWAPELIHDKNNNRWMIYWASSVEGRFTETVQQNRPRANNRMYCAFTKNFKTFSKPKLLFDEHIVNDTRIINVDSPHGRYCMVTKHITEPGKSARLYLTYSHNIEGPYKRTKDRFDYISDPHRFCEGPAVIKIDAYYYLYFDLSREHRMACRRNQQMTSDGWEDISDRINLPPHVKHGDILRIPMTTYNRLEKIGK